MTSAILTSLDEPSWGKSGGGLMRKSSHSNNLNTNPKLHSISKKTQNFPVLDRHVEDFPAVTQTSDDAHSFSQRPSDSNGLEDDFKCGGKVTYNISSYTRIELIDLKRKLIAELEQIQTLKDRVDAGDFQSRRPSHKLAAAKDRNGSGKKRPLPFVSEKNSSRPPPAVVPASRLNAKEIDDIMMVCRRFLTTLLKQKRCWVFKKPVDAAALGLHDYHQIVKHPMDLGTVKIKLYNSSYKTPLDFAADVRLTFNNAILYNPRTDDVHRWAVELLDRFEELFKPVEERLLMGPSRAEKQPQLRQNSWNHIPTPEIDRTNKPRSIGNGIPHVESPPVVPSSKNPPSVPPPPSRTPMKQPKPSARDPNKREMSMEEKQKLGVGLESLPQEKMAQLMHIMKKRNQHLVQDGDEIELDFSSLDTETLWELDRFVTNCKKMMSKTRRQALIGNTSNQADDPTSSGSPSSSAEENVDDTVKKAKKWEGGEEDVDIGGDDDMPMNTFPPLEIEKDEGSSSDTSSSSSTSDSEDSRSSSGSDSDAQSRGMAEEDT